jgi:hypothetical protein
MEPLAKSKCLLCKTPLYINYDDIRYHHWYEDVKGTWHYNYYFADINDIVICDRCSLHVNLEDIEVPNHIPRIQNRTYTVKYLRNQYNICGSERTQDPTI